MIKRLSDARATCQSLLKQLKILMTTFQSMPPMGIEGPNATQERTLVRDVMEVAVFLSARERDTNGFQRHMAQVRCFSGDLPYSIFQRFASIAL